MRLEAETTMAMEELMRTAGEFDHDEAGRATRASRSGETCFANLNSCLWIVATNLISSPTCDFSFNS